MTVLLEAGQDKDVDGSLLGPFCSLLLPSSSLLSPSLPLASLSPTLLLFVIGASRKQNMQPQTKKYIADCKSWM